jgi:hypothetical protein
MAVETISFGVGRAEQIDVTMTGRLWLFPLKAQPDPHKATVVQTKTAPWWEPGAVVFLRMSVRR